MFYIQKKKKKNKTDTQPSSENCFISASYIFCYSCKCWVKGNQKKSSLLLSMSTMSTLNFEYEYDIKISMNAYYSNRFEYSLLISVLLREFWSIYVKYEAAKYYGLRLRFSNSNLSSQTQNILI